ncbi:hypothetical protein CBL_07524 [Carabus blaptoides fortunei]
MSINHIGEVNNCRAGLNMQTTEETVIPKILKPHAAVSTNRFNTSFKPHLTSDKRRFILNPLPANAVSSIHHCFIVNVRQFDEYMDDNRQSFDVYTWLGACHVIGHL